jgi:uncharacterized protein with GYD domain
MAKYLVEASYTLEGIKGLKASGGSSRLQAVEEAVKGLGGTVDGFYFAFGETDVYVIVDLPNAIDAAALSLSVCAGGGARTRTTALLTPQEMDEAARRQVGYRPPA